MENESFEQLKQKQVSKIKKMQSTQEQIKFAFEPSMNIICGDFIKENKLVSVCHEGGNYYKVHFKSDNQYVGTRNLTMRDTPKIKEKFMNITNPTINDIDNWIEEEENIREKKKDQKYTKKMEKAIPFWYSGRM